MCSFGKQQMAQQDPNQPAGLGTGLAPRSAQADPPAHDPSAPSLGRSPATDDLVPPELLALRGVLAELKDLKIARKRLQLETALEQSGLPEAAQILIRQV